MASLGCNLCFFVPMQSGFVAVFTGGYIRLQSERIRIAAAVREQLIDNGRSGIEFPLVTEDPGSVNGGMRAVRANGRDLGSSLDHTFKPSAI
jgi:hypothetical protein